MLAASLVLAGASTAARAQDVAASREQLTAASNDIDNPFSNSTVRIRGTGGTCTGTLIAPQVVITAAHCGVYDGRLGWDPDKWFDLRPTTLETFAEFGANSASFRDRIRVTHANMPGSRDLILLGLERAPAPGVAVPRRPLLDPHELPPRARWQPKKFWSRQILWAVGWGGRDPGSHAGNLATIRQVARAGSAVIDCNVWPGAICAFSTLSGGSQTRGGDSGGPLYWRNPDNGREYLVGVLQGYGPQGDRYHYPWSDIGLAWPGDQGGAPINLNQREWIRKAIDRSFCGVLRRGDSERSPTPLLSTWWNPTNGDNFATTDPWWSGCEGDSQRGYGFAGVLGRVYREGAQPAGAVPIYHWWSPSREDNFLTSDPNWAGRAGDRRAPDYTMVRVLGYVQPSSARPGSTLLPLWSWWSAQRGDNFATTAPSWGPEGGGDHFPDYRYYRLEGHVLRP